MTRQFSKSSFLPVTAREAFDWHARKGAFERLVPPWEDIRVKQTDQSIEIGSKLIMELHKGPGFVTWEALHTELVPPEDGKPGYFLDISVRGPFRVWNHKHIFQPEDDGVELIDQISYELPVDGLVPSPIAAFSEEELQRMFDFRHQRTQNDLTLHKRYAGKPLKIAITGATGLVGTALSAFLTTGGHEVVPVSRSRSTPGSIYWDIDKGEIDQNALEGLDAVIHLAGESISGRWTDSKKEKIRQSRVKGTELLANTLAKLKHPPEVFISTSAVGYYGDRGDLPTTELTAKGEGFLADVCKAWENAAKPAEEAGIRTVHPRLGVVLSASGGALQPMLPAFKIGLGGPVGDGRQYMSWIALDDVLGAMLHILNTPGLSGPVNLTAPAPVQNRDFGKTLAKVLNRPSFIPLPKFAVNLALGEMGDALLLEGARVIPEKLQNSDYKFVHPTLEGALRFELGKA